MKKVWLKILTKEFLVEQYVDLRKSIQDVANEVRCSYSTIRNYLKKHNIPIRNISEAHKGKKCSEETRQKISEANSGENNPRFKGKTKKKNGYILIYMSNHPYKNSHNNVPEQRLVVETQIGRYLDPKWVVHHINKIKDDNRSENLICFTSESAHQRFHHNSNNVKPEEIIFDGRKLKKEIL